MLSYNILNVDFKYLKALFLDAVDSSDEAGAMQRVLNKHVSYTHVEYCDICRK